MGSKYWFGVFFILVFVAVGYNVNKDFVQYQPLILNKHRKRVPTVTLPMVDTLSQLIKTNYTATV